MCLLVLEQKHTQQSEIYVLTAAVLSVNMARKIYASNFIRIKRAAERRVFTFLLESFWKRRSLFSRFSQACFQSSRARGYSDLVLLILEM